MSSIDKLHDKLTSLTESITSDWRDINARKLPKDEREKVLARIRELEEKLASLRAGLQEE